MDLVQKLNMSSVGITRADVMACAEDWVAKGTSSTCFVVCASFYTVQHHDAFAHRTPPPPPASSPRAWVEQLFLIASATVLQSAAATGAWVNVLVSRRHPRVCGVTVAVRRCVHPLRALLATTACLTRSLVCVVLGIMMTPQPSLRHLPMRLQRLRVVLLEAAVRLRDVDTARGGAPDREGRPGPGACVWDAYGDTRLVEYGCVPVRVRSHSSACFRTLVLLYFFSTCVCVQCLCSHPRARG